MLAAGFLLVSAGLLLATFDERVLRGIRGTLFAPEIESQLQPQLSQPQQQQPLLLPRQRSAIVDTRPAPPAAQAGPPTAASSPGSQFRAPTVNQSELRLGEIPFETALQYHRVAVYSPALAVHATNPPSLWAYLRYEGRNTTDKWDQCPLDHPSRLIPCPRNDLRMISFNVRCELNPATLMCR